MTPRETSALVEKTFAHADALDRTAKAPRSGCCNAPIQGSAVKWCGGCGATLDNATRLPLSGIGGAR